MISLPNRVSPSTAATVEVAGVRVTNWVTPAAASSPTWSRTCSTERSARTAEDQIAVTGTLAGGAVASVHLRGANAHATPLLWEINGTQGDLQISGTGATLASPLTIRGARGDAELAELPVPAKYDAHAGLSGTPAHAVAHAYDRIRADLDAGTRTAPDFAHALRRHRLLDAVESAAAGGTRQQITA